jgi:hypothetical protein
MTAVHISKMTGKLDGLTRYQHQHRDQSVLSENEYVRRYHMPQMLLAQYAQIIPEEHASQSAAQFGSICPRVLDQSELPTIYRTLSFVSMRMVN